MAYLYKKIIHGRPYYYLRISKRINGKIVVKDVAYLGSDITTVECKLDKLHTYAKDIRKGYRHIKKFIQTEHYIKHVRDKKLKHDPYLQKDRLQRIEALKLHYNRQFLRANKLTQREAYHHFLIDFAFNSTSIEGNTISLAEARKLLEEEILPKNKTLREVYDLQNTEKLSVNEHLLIDIHDKLLDKIDKRKGYRTHEIRVFRARFDAAPAKFIRTDMRLLWKWFKDNKKKLHPLVLATLFHHKLEKIHPFSDGNGRTGRMFMNYLLMKNKYPPLIISNKKRALYLKTLAHADRENIKGSNVEHYKTLVVHVSDELLDSYWNAFMV
jgi:Fic family protein